MDSAAASKEKQQAAASAACCSTSSCLRTAAAALGEGAARKAKRQLARKLLRSRVRQARAEALREELSQQLALSDYADLDELRQRVVEENRTAQERLQKESATDFSSFLIDEAAWEARERALREELQQRASLATAADNRSDVVLGLQPLQESADTDDGEPEIIFDGDDIIIKRAGKGSSQTPKFLRVTPTRALVPTASTPRLCAKDAIAEDNFGTEKSRMYCPFYLKVGACRFGARCSRAHPRPEASSTLLMPGMFAATANAQDELEADEDAEMEQFLEFYQEVHAEFAHYGTIVNFKVCRNKCPHLRGNVYVQFHAVESAVSAFAGINSRYYDGKQVACEFVPVNKWRSAICGAYSRGQVCPRGETCNFLHPFPNPGGAYRRADLDIPESLESHKQPQRRDGSSHRRSHHRSRSRSRSRSQSRSRSRWKDRRSRSRERSFNMASSHGCDGRQKRDRDDVRHNEKRHSSKHERRKHEAVQRDVEPQSLAERGRWGDES
eukprot:jgi/Chlat1/332/Chrsp1S03194